MVNFKRVLILWFVTIISVYSEIDAQTADTLFFLRHISTPKSQTSRIASIGIPALMITYGTISLTKSRILEKWDNCIKTFLHEKRYIVHTSLDNYLQFVPSVAAFGMKAAGMKSSHKLRDMTVLFALSNLMETGIVYTLKIASSRMRPDQSANNSFPSGHTATAFVAAEFLHQEYGHKSVYISTVGYTVATLVGVGRMLNNRHWFSDVVAGAGIGILSVKAIYWVYPSLQKTFHKKETKIVQSSFYPSYENGAFCLNFSHNF
jgi:membrane-associated phospholipid phosphatase